MIYTNLDLKAMGLSGARSEYRQMSAPDMAARVARAKCCVIDTETYARDFDSRAFIDGIFLAKYKERKKVTSVTRKAADRALQEERKQRATDPMRSSIRLLQVATWDGTERGAKEPDIYVADSHVGGMKRIVSALQGKPIIGQNLKFDLKEIWATWPSFRPGEMWDVMAAHRIASASESTAFVPANLQAVVARWANIYLEKAHGGDNWEGSISRDMFKYACLDVMHLPKIMMAQVAELEHRSECMNDVPYFMGMAHDKVTIIEMKFIEPLARSELAGIPINVKILSDRAAVLAEQVAVLQAPYDKIGINTKSPAQLMKFFIAQGIDVDGTAYEDLVRIPDFNKNPVVVDLIHLKEAQKELSMIQDYVERSQASLDGRIRASFNQQRAADGRMSCREPNMQQIPRRLKQVIYGKPKGRAVLKADYPGIEARVMAVVARDHVLIKLFREGGDMHVNTGKYVLGMTKEEVNKNPDSRYKVKSINFGMIFGMGAKNFVKYAYTSFGINIELDEAERIKQKFFEVYRGIKALHDLHGRLLREQPFIIMQTILGRRMRVDRFTNANNYPVQGSAADMLKLACVLFFNKCRKQKLDACIINYVHDELVVETSRAHAAKARRALRESMEQAADYVIQLFHTDVEVEEIK